MCSILKLGLLMNKTIKHLVAAIKHSWPLIKWHNYRFKFKSRARHSPTGLNKKGLQRGKPTGYEGRRKGAHLSTDPCSGNQAAIVPDTKTTNFLCQYSLQQDNYGVWKTINMHVSLHDLQRSYLLIQDILNVEIICALQLHVWGSFRSCFKITLSACVSCSKLTWMNIIY